MKKVILLTNILTPYRKFFYDLLYKVFKDKNIDFRVLVTAETEPNRSWKYEEFKSEYTFLVKGKVYSISDIYIHVNEGIYEYLKQEKPDVVVSAGTYLYPALWTVLKNKRKLDYKVFYWNESHLQEVKHHGGLKLALREAIRKKVFRKFDGYWYGGQLSLALINKYATKDSYKVFVPNTIDNKLYNSVVARSIDERLSAKQKYNLSDGKIVLFCPARLTWVKGQYDFLKVFFKSNLCSKFTILFAGSGEMKDDLQNLIDMNADKSDVRLLGYLNQNETLDYYSVSDFLLLPSYSDPNPLTCIEALWCGLPLLVSNHVGNYPEVIKEDINGYVFSFKDEQNIISILENIVANNANWYNNARKTSLEVATEIYNAEDQTNRIVSEMISIFENNSALISS